jgi:predicted transcriptional regulator
MDDYLQQALDIVKAQASVRVMAEDEITSMVRTLATQLRTLENNPASMDDAVAPAISPAGSIKERSVTCLECGKTFKIITRRHLSLHGHDADSYREKWGIKKGAPLVCKALQRERRKKMHEMKLWEKRRAVGKKKVAGNKKG